MPTFHVRGGFKIPSVFPTLGGQKVDTSKHSISRFWAATGGLDKDHGCYIFSMSRKGGSKPWYVGKASSTSFGSECFSAHKLVIFNDVMSELTGVPYLTFLTPAKTKGKTPTLAIDEVEEYLIGNAASRNPGLANKRRLPNQKWTIENVTKPTIGAPPNPVVQFRRLMGM